MLGSRFSYIFLAIEPTRTMIHSSRESPGRSRKVPLFGAYYVKPTATAIVRAYKLCGDSVRDVMKIRQHALKLAFWPNEADLDWEWIQALKNKRIGELRIDEAIAGNNNLRVIFFKANKPLPNEPLPRIWSLTVLQKKSQHFTAGDLQAFSAMRDIIVFRNYHSIPGA